MTDTPIATGYMIQDIQGTAIYGIGSTVDEAWAEVVRDAGPFFDRYGEEIPDEEAFTTQFTAYGASAALLAQVEAEGGAISWKVVRGVGVTMEEATELVDDDWREFRREVCDFYDRNPNVTIAQVMRIFGADYADVKRALMQEGKA